jgi:acyl-CoA synthetase (AMP-forming)/AMP-acid ligase II
VRVANSVAEPLARLSLRRLVEHWALRTPEAIAIAAPGRAPLTYHRLLERIDAVAGTLAARGIGTHDRVAVALPNGPGMAVAFLSVASAFCCAPLNPAYRATEAAAHLRRLSARALIVERRAETAARLAADSLGIPVIALSPRAQDDAGIFDLEGSPMDHRGKHRAAEADDVALVLQTSGTTSEPKIVPLTRLNLCTSARNVSAALARTAHDRCLGHTWDLEILDELALAGEQSRIFAPFDRPPDPLMILPALVHSHPRPHRPLSLRLLCGRYSQ